MVNYQQGNRRVEGQHLGQVICHLLKVISKDFSGSDILSRLCMISSIRYGLEMGLLVNDIF